MVTFADQAHHAVRSALANLQGRAIRGGKVDTTHSGLCTKFDKFGSIAQIRINTRASDLCQFDNAFAFGGAVCQAGDVGSFCQACFDHPWYGQKGCRLTVAQGNCAGFVEQQRVNVARHLDGTT